MTTKKNGQETIGKRNLARTRGIIFSGVVAALYVVLTLPFAQFAYGPIQFRLAEILAILPIFTGAAIPGVTIGCLIANLLNPSALGPIDIIFGSLATLIAAFLTRVIARRSKHKWLGIIPPILVNGVIVGGYLAFLLAEGEITYMVVLISMASVAASEAGLLIVLGLPLLTVIRKTKLQGFLERIDSKQDKK